MAHSGSSLVVLFPPFPLSLLFLCWWNLLWICDNNHRLIYILTRTSLFFEEGEGGWAGSRAGLVVLGEVERTTNGPKDVVVHTRKRSAGEKKRRRNNNNKMYATCLLLLRHRLAFFRSGCCISNAVKSREKLLFDRWYTLFLSPLSNRLNGNYYNNRYLVRGHNTHLNKKYSIDLVFKLFISMIKCRKRFILILLS